MHTRVIGHLGAGMVILALLATGCERQDSVRRYRVAKAAPKAEPAAPATSAPSATAGPADPAGPAAADGPDQMLAAIVTRGDRVWTFKFTGPVAVVARHIKAFDAILASLNFDESGNATWKTPETWQQLPPSGMRFATLVPERGAHGVDFSVISLPAPQDVMANVNRWRGQMQLPEVSDSELDDVTRRITTASGDEAVVVDLHGHLQAGMMGPFAGAPAAPGSAAGPLAPPAAEKESPVRFTAPKEWSPRPTRMSQVNVFEVIDGDRKAEVSISVLSRAGGEMLPNINRWRSQLQLAPWTAAELDAAVSDRRIGDMDASLVELIPDGAEAPRATIGAIGYRGNEAWFFKLTGDAALVRSERERFESFLKSIAFESD